MNVYKSVKGKPPSPFSKCVTVKEAYIVTKVHFH